MDDQAPNPFEGAASVDSAAEALHTLIGTRRKPEAESVKPAAEKPLVTATSEPEPKDKPAATPEKSAETQEGEDKGEAETAQRYEVKVNGETREVTLDELRNGFMMHQDYSKKSREVADQRKAFEAQRSEAITAAKTQIDQLGFLSNELMQEMVQVDKTTNWEHLRATNPAEFAARALAQQQRRDKLQRAYNTYLGHQKELDTHSQAKKEARLAEQSELLLAKVPEWTNEEIAGRERQQLAEYLQADGYDDKEIEDLDDHRVIALARKAMLFDRQQEQKQAIAAKAAKPVPKFQKGGTATSDAKDHDLTQQRDRFRKSGRLEDMAALLHLKTRKE